MGMTVSELVTAAGELVSDYTAVVGAGAVIALGGILLRRLISAAR